jgi:methionyl-tRNA synthetase
VKLLWTVYQFYCRSCGRFLYEARVPSDRKWQEYKPVSCGHCDSILIHERIKGAA